MKIRNVLSLFDGISCGQVALERAEIKYDNYYASEIDKYAIQVTQKNYPDTIQLGDINNWKSWEIDWSSIDLIMGGSPCQGFSNAGKGLNFDDPRSKLFFVFVDILNHVKQYNPNVIFLLENVKMKKEWQDVITEYMGVKPIIINSALVSAQNRVRLFWTNIKNIQQPKDKGILLKDILLTNVIRIPVYGNKEKSRPLTSHYSNNFGGWYARISDPNPNKQQIDVLVEGYPCDFINQAKEIDKFMIDKSRTLLARDYKGFGNQAMTGVIVPICVNSQSGSRCGKRKQPSLSDRIYNINAKNPALTSSYQTKITEPMLIDEDKDLGDYLKGRLGKISNKYGYLPEMFNPYNASEIIHKAPSQTTTCSSWTSSSTVVQIVPLYYSSNNKNVFEVIDNKITIYDKAYEIKLPNGFYSFRKLHPIECERLQTLPDNYTDEVSNSQRYKALGNGWTVDVIVHILNKLKGGKNGQKKDRQF